MRTKKEVKRQMHNELNICSRRNSPVLKWDSDRWVTSWVWAILVVYRPHWQRFGWHRTPAATLHGWAQISEPASTWWFVQLEAMLLPVYSMTSAGISEKTSCDDLTVSSPSGSVTRTSELATPDQHHSFKLNYTTSEWVTTNQLYSFKKLLLTTGILFFSVFF